MKAGADPNIMDNKGRSAFDYAEFYCRDDILQWMKEYQNKTQTKKTIEKLF